MRRAFLGLSLLLLALAACVASGGVRAVEAHALLSRADPPPNSQVREPPTQLTLYFTESLEKRFTRARVLDQSNAEVQERIEFDSADDTVMRVFLKPVKPGYLTVFWENVSAVDGHRISGSYPLTILNADGSVPAGSPPSGGAQTEGAQAEPGRVAVKALLLVSGSLLTGTLVFLLFVIPALQGAESARSALWRRATFTLAAALVGLVLFGLVELALQARDLSTDVATVLDTRWGGRWLLRNLALLLPLAVVALLALIESSRRGAVVIAGLVGAIVYMGFTSSVSHAGAGDGAFWAVAADLVHLAAASVWIGMLAQVVLLFVWAGKNLEGDERYSVLSAALRRFSALATVSVALLLFTGFVSAVIEVGRLSDLLGTSYGQALTAKLLLLVPLLGIGAVNAYVLRPDLQEATEVTSLRNRGAILADLESQLSRLVRYEFAIAVAVLAIVGLLSQTTPTRGVDTSQAGGKYTATKEVSDIGVTLVVDPNQPGPNTFEVYLTGAVETVERVRLDFIPKGKPDEEARLILDASNPPTFYVGQGAFLAQPGKWEVAVDLRRTRGNDLRIPFEVQVIGAGGQASVSGGGSFASPVSFSPASVALLVASGVLAVVVVAGSAPRPGLPAGYVGEFVGAVSERVSISKLRPAWSLAVLVFIGVALGLVLGGHIDRPLSKDQAAQGNPVKSTPESIARGQMLFNQNCALCHGESGRGDGPAATGLRIQPANLYDHVPYHPDQFFFGAITNGIGGVMPSFKSTLSEQDRWHILNFLRDRFGDAPVVQ